MATETSSHTETEKMLIWTPQNLYQSNTKLTSGGMTGCLGFYMLFP